MSRFLTDSLDGIEIIRANSVIKHGTHDQKTHGNWATGGMGAGVADSILLRVRENGGLSVNMVDGSEPTSGYMVAKGAKYGSVVSADDFYDPIKGPKILADYMKKHKAELGGGKNYLGLWHNKDDGQVYLDVSENIQDKERAISAGQKQDQISIWDVTNFAEIETGGTGNVEKTGSGRTAKEHRRNERFRNRSLRPKNLGEVGKAYKVIRFEPGLIPVLKHQEHDQSTHGSWATGGVLFKQDKNLLTMQDKSGKTLASVNFVNLGNNRLDINSIDSFDEGKGYATKVLEKLYSSFPQHSIFWGKTILPASTHLAQKFFDKYGRTEFMPWGEGAIAGYEWGELYGDTTVKKHQEHDQSTHGSWADGYTPEERARMDEMSTLGPALEDLDAILEGGGPGPDLDDLKMLVENDEGLYSEAISGIEERVAAYLENYPNAEYNTVFDEEQTKMIDEFIDNSDPGYLAGLWMEQEGTGDTEEMLSNVTPYFEEIFNTDHTVVNAAGDAVTTLSSEIQYVGMTTDTPSGDEGISVKGKIEDFNGNYAGEFERIFYKEDGVWIVEHKLLKLDDDYKGLGFGKEFIDRSEDWYTQRGFGAITVGTGWDGARVWARDGFDWDPESTQENFEHILEARITGTYSGRMLDEFQYGEPARLEFDALMERATNGYVSDENGPRWDSIKDFRNEDFPLPNDFLMIGYKDKTTSDYEHPVTGDTKKAVTWAGERLFADLNLKYVKILTPEGRNLFEGPVDRDGDGLVYDGTAREKPASAVKS